MTALDINGDGYDDLAIGAPGEDAESGEGVGATDFVGNTGVVYIIPGDADGLETSENDIFWSGVGSLDLVLRILIDDKM